jgi:hypothetical protein
MQQSPSSETNISLASQEIPDILRKQNVYYSAHKHLQIYFVLSQINPLHILQFSFIWLSGYSDSLHLDGRGSIPRQRQKCCVYLKTSVQISWPIHPPL